MRASFRARGWIARFSFLVLAAGASASAARAQFPMFDFHPDTWGTSGEMFGAAMSSVGDVDGDGQPDVAVGSPRYGPQSCGDYVGAVRVMRSTVGSSPNYSYSGGGSLCYTCGCNTGEARGFAVDGLGDINLDGNPDFVMSAPNWGGGTCACTNSGYVWVLSRIGGTWSTVYSHSGPGSWDYLGYSVSAAGDCNNDGYPDYALGAPGAYNPGNVRTGRVDVRSGFNGQLLWSAYGLYADDNFGWSVSGLGDVNGDQHDDIVVGTHLADNVSGGVIVDCGSVTVLSGSDGSRVYTIYGSATGARFGRVVAGAGNLGGNAVPDILVQEDTANAEKVYVLSGFGGGVLFQPIPNPAPADIGFGDALSGVGDVNGDGVLDFAIGGPGDNGNTGSVGVYTRSAGAWSNIQTIRGFAANDRFGASVDGLSPGIDEGGDWDGDGTDDVLIGATGAWNNWGQVSVYSVDCPEGVRYCQTTPNEVGSGAIIDSNNQFSQSANSLVLTASQCPTFKSGLFFFGSTRTNLVYCSHHCIQAPTFRWPVVTTDSNGVATFAVDFTAYPAAGLMAYPSTWDIQFWYRDPYGPCASGTNKSDAIEIYICP